MDAPSTPETHCGYVTLLGAPNAGKSTLMNVLVGEPLSIVTSKAQTTWRRVTGIRTAGRHQMIFLDTPGVLEPRDLLQRTLVSATRTALREADVLVVVADPSRPLSNEGRVRLEELARLSPAPRIGVVNKVDAASAESIASEATWLAELVGDTAHRVSALRSEGLDRLVETIARSLPAGPFLYPEDDVASEPVRAFAAEFVREAIFEDFRNEVPYSTYCEVEAFREDPDRTYVQVVIYVERESQKGILIGKGGRAIRALGTKARQRIEHMVDRPVYLDLWIKVLPGWRKKKGHLERLGFTVPEDDETTHGA